MKTILFLVAVLPIISFSQDLEKHQWKDRLLLILTDSYENPELQLQLQELKNNSDNLQDRKLVLYQVTPTSYREGIKKKTPIKTGSIYKKHNPSNENFKVILIGLDGGMKLKSNKLLSSAQIFDQIDQMPIRRQELRIKN